MSIIKDIIKSIRLIEDRSINVFTKSVTESFNANTDIFDSIEDLMNDNLGDELDDLYSRFDLFSESMHAMDKDIEVDSEFLPTAKDPKTFAEKFIKNVRNEISDEYLEKFLLENGSNVINVKPRRQDIRKMTVLEYFKTEIEVLMKLV